jgi:predicted GNAT superfamily acetyltransferase
MLMNNDNGYESHDLRSAAILPILTLNNLHAEQTSFLDERGLAQLLAISCYTRGIEHGMTAMLIALDHNAGYDNPNFQWFRSRYERFIYVDRIIVSRAARGRGLARSLYRNLFAWAELSGQSQVVCEVNIRPANHASEAFHRELGFVDVGQANLRNGLKSVRYFQKILQGNAELKSHQSLDSKHRHPSR